MAHIDMIFPVRGTTIPADHGYQLFSAISHIVPEIHGNTSIAIQSINGLADKERNLKLTDRSRLMVRVSSEDISAILKISGAKLGINHSTITIGVPLTKALIPGSRLYSRIVIIKGCMDPILFFKALSEDLTSLGIKGVASLVEQPRIKEENDGKVSGTHSEFLRRTVKIRGKNIVGFAVRVAELTAEESILLQEKGIGGRQRFGCGIFIPDRR